MILEYPFSLSHIIRLFYVYPIYHHHLKQSSSIFITLHCVSLYMATFNYSIRFFGLFLFTAFLLPLCVSSVLLSSRRIIANKSPYTKNKLVVLISSTFFSRSFSFFQHAALAIDPIRHSTLYNKPRDQQVASRYAHSRHGTHFFT